MMASNPTAEFRAEAVRVTLTSGLPQKQVAADIGVGFSTLRRWIQQDRRNPEKPTGQSNLECEIVKLRKESCVLRDGMVLLAHIRDQFARSLGSYGRPRMTAELKESGLPVGHRRVGRLMRDICIASVRAHLERLLEQGSFEELDKLLDGTGVPKEDLKALQSIHPSFMGGKYLPDLEKGEVEIARIELASTTGDVTSLYAKKLDGRYMFRVVDEYEGETLSGNVMMEAGRPLTLGQMAEFFLSAWPLIDVLEMNDLQWDIDSALCFFLAKSEFYPNFHAHCVEKVTAHFGRPKQNDNLI